MRLVKLIPAKILLPIEAVWEYKKTQHREKRQQEPYFEVAPGQKEGRIYM